MRLSVIDIKFPSRSRILAAIFAALISAATGCDSREPKDDGGTPPKASPDSQLAGLEAASDVPASGGAQMPRTFAIAGPIWEGRTLVPHPSQRGPWRVESGVQLPCTIEGKLARLQAILEDVTSHPVQGRVRNGDLPDPYMNRRTLTDDQVESAAIAIRKHYKWLQQSQNRGRTESAEVMLAELREASGSAIELPGGDGGYAEKVRRASAQSRINSGIGTAEDVQILSADTPCRCPQALPNAADLAAIDERFRVFFRDRKPLVDAMAEMVTPDEASLLKLRLLRDPATMVANLREAINSGGQSGQLGLVESLYSVCPDFESVLGGLGRLQQLWADERLFQLTRKEGQQGGEMAEDLLIALNKTIDPGLRIVATTCLLGEHQTRSALSVAYAMRDDRGRFAEKELVAEIQIIPMMHLREGVIAYEALYGVTFLADLEDLMQEQPQAVKQRVRDEIQARASGMNIQSGHK